MFDLISALLFLFIAALSPPTYAANVISMSIGKAAPTFEQLKHRNLQTRASITESLFNNITGGAYQADVTVGTPGQKISLVIDTGSSDIYVLDKNADYCSSTTLQHDGCTGGTFDTSASSTFKTVLKGGFNITYADSTGSSGDYISDTFSIGGGVVKTLQMGLATSTTVGVGIMGIGYDTNEAARTLYPNFIDQMVSQGLINTKAYSLYLNDLQSSTGSILFGGIDTAKYIGSLIGVPVQKDANSRTYSSFTVAMTSLTISSSNGSSSTLTSTKFTAPVILDSGTTLTYLPDSLVSTIISHLGAVDDSQNSGNIYVRCALATSDPSLAFTYGFGGTGGPQIKVLINELVLPYSSLFGSSSTSGLPFGSSTCALGISGSGSSGINLLGDTFLRSAYVVYDISHNQIAMAQTNFNATDSNLVEITASATGIPLVSGVASQVVASQTATGVPGLGKPTSTQSSGTQSSGGTTSKSAAVHRVPAFDRGGLTVLCLFGLFAVLGGSWYLA